MPGVLGYLPQTLPLAGDWSVAEVLGVSTVIEALNAVESGDTAEEHFTVIGDDWDIEERTAAQLDRLGLGGLALTRRLDTLSGVRPSRSGWPPSCSNARRAAAGRTDQ